MQVFFVGAGPGDPELVTVKGQRLIAVADTIIYAGSLVNPEILASAKPQAEIHNSASLTLEEVVEIIEQSVKAGKNVVRLHTGDPSLYGAIKEQMDLLDARQITYEIVPGVSSFLAAAAALRCEYTLPEVSQTLIITRLEGRTAVPEKEKLALLASHNCSMCIFLSVHMFDAVIAELLKGGYSEDTPVAVVEKASWPDEKIFRGTLATIGRIVGEAGIARTAMIVVGDCLEGEYALSQLYSPNFSHMFREAR